MNILYVNLNRCGGIESIGDMFLDILSRISPIDSIDVYYVQCCDLIKDWVKYNKKYDIVIFNEGHSEDMIFKTIIDNINYKYIFNISHGTLKDSYDFNAVFDLNYEYICQSASHIYNIFPLKYCPGNIWENKNLERQHKNFIYAGRINEWKIPYDILIKYKNEIDVYGQITDQEYFDKIKDIINYKGNVSHKELSDIYNTYEKSILFSKTECLSISLREQLLCGLIPHVIDDCGFTNSISRYCNKESTGFNKEFDFDKMILDFLLILRGITLIDFKFDKSKICEINILYSENKEHINEKYSYDYVNWDKVKI